MRQIDFIRGKNTYIAKGAEEELERLLTANFIQQNRRYSQRIYDKCVNVYTSILYNLYLLANSTQNATTIQTSDGYRIWNMRYNGKALGVVYYQLYSNHYETIIILWYIKINTSTFGLYDENRKTRKNIVEDDKLVKQILVSYITECVIRRLKAM